jgi:hypothetical protein
VYPNSKKTITKKRAGRVAQGEGPEFKLQYQKKKNKKQIGYTQWESEDTRIRTEVNCKAADGDGSDLLVPACIHCGILSTGPWHDSWDRVEC